MSEFELLAALAAASSGPGLTYVEAGEVGALLDCEGFEVEGDLEQLVIEGLAQKADLPPRFAPTARGLYEVWRR